MEEMNVLKKKAAQGCGWAVQWRWLHAKLRKVVHGVLFGVDSSTIWCVRLTTRMTFTTANVCGGKGSYLSGYDVIIYVYVYVCIWQNDGRTCDGVPPSVFHAEAFGEGYLPEPSFWRRSASSAADGKVSTPLCRLSNIENVMN